MFYHLLDGKCRPLEPLFSSSLLLSPRPRNVLVGSGCQTWPGRQMIRFHDILWLDPNPDRSPSSPTPTRARTCWSFTHRSFCILFSLPLVTSHSLSFRFHDCHDSPTVFPLSLGCITLPCIPAPGRGRWEKKDDWQMRFQKTRVAEVVGRPGHAGTSPSQPARALEPALPAPPLPKLAVRQLLQPFTAAQQLVVCARRRRFLDFPSSKLHIRRCWCRNMNSPIVVDVHFLLFPCAGRAGSTCPFPRRFTACQCGGVWRAGGIGTSGTHTPTGERRRRSAAVTFSVFLHARSCSCDPTPPLLFTLRSTTRHSQACDVNWPFNSVHRSRLELRLVSDVNG